MTKTTIVSTIMRVVVGILFVAHGVSKMQMGIGNVEAWFSSMGVSGWLAYMVAPLELAGGSLLIVGLFTRVISAMFTIMLLGAIVTMKLSVGLLGNEQMAGYELDLAYMLVTIYLATTKSVPLSLDHLFFRKSSLS